MLTPALIMLVRAITTPPPSSVLLRSPPTEETPPFNSSASPPPTRFYTTFPLSLSLLTSSAFFPLLLCRLRGCAWPRRRLLPLLAPAPLLALSLLQLLPLTPQPPPRSFHLRLHSIPPRGRAEAAVRARAAQQQQQLCAMAP
jgi:hypothetical protein